MDYPDHHLQQRSKGPDNVAFWASLQVVVWPLLRAQSRTSHVIVKFETRGAKLSGAFHFSKVLARWVCGGVSVRPSGQGARLTDIFPSVSGTAMYTMSTSRNAGIMERPWMRPLIRGPGSHLQCEDVSFHFMCGSLLTRNFHDILSHTSKAGASQSQEG